MFQQFTFNHVLFLAQSTLVTLQLVGIALAGGAVGSAIITAMLISPIRPIRWLAELFVFIIQGTPIIVTLFMAYYGLPMMGLNLDQTWSMTFAFAIFTSAFLGEIWRSSLAAVPKGQWESAHALGLSWRTTMGSIIVPQAMRIAIPPSIGFLVQLVKGTSVVSIIGIAELTRAAQIVSNATFKPLPVFLTAAAFYFAINFPLTMLSRHLERRFKVGGMVKSH
ncbi:ABC transporter permease [Devosia yakushimensis]|uniref:ABC transporter permease n=1 Tax=Devosia yakushimensis TaxID=470028 RepID=A0ABQ5UL30_9HYPH|nr:amino acid ABC transporter permease [Devosia yakushimensis]GLQ12057.1 ABC transporter permease [Devosia yakushimensis]